MGVSVQFLVSCVGGPAPGPYPVLSPPGLVFSVSPAASCLLRFPDGSAHPGTSSPASCPSWRLSRGSSASPRGRTSCMPVSPRAPGLHEDPACGSGSSVAPCVTGSVLPPSCCPGACVREDREKPRCHPGKEQAPCWNLKEGAGEGETRSHRGAPAPGQLFPCTIPFACHDNAVRSAGFILSRAPGALRLTGLSWVTERGAWSRCFPCDSGQPFPDSEVGIPPVELLFP